MDGSQGLRGRASSSEEWPMTGLTGCCGHAAHGVVWATSPKRKGC